MFLLYIQFFEVPSIQSLADLLNYKSISSHEGSIRLHPHYREIWKQISITIYSRVFSHASTWPEATNFKRICPRFEMAAGSFEPISLEIRIINDYVRHSRNWHRPFTNNYQWYRPTTVTTLARLSCLKVYEMTNQCRFTCSYLLSGVFFTKPNALHRSSLEIPSKTHFQPLHDISVYLMRS